MYNSQLMKITHIAMLFALCLSIGCGKDGEPGKDGIDGTNGQDGSANVQPFNYTIENWGYDGNHYFVEVNETNGFTLSANDLATGALMSYIKSGSSFFALPYVSFLGNNTTQHYRPVYSENKFRIWVDNSTGGDTYPELDGPREIKIVIIPQAQRLAEPDLDLTNYQEVKRVFNLKD